MIKIGSVVFGLVLGPLKNNIANIQIKKKILGFRDFKTVIYSLTTQQRFFIVVLSLLLTIVYCENVKNGMAIKLKGFSPTMRFERS